MSKSASQTNDRCTVCGEKLVSPAKIEGKLTRQEIRRRHRRVHYEWSEVDFDEDDDPYLSKNLGPDHKDLDEECQLETQSYEVTFHDEYVETVVVEAASKSEAKRFAEHERTYDGELIETIHTEKREIGDPSQASIEYLELVGLLPENHDVEPSDLKALVDDE